MLWLNLRTFEDPLRFGHVVERWAGGHEGVNGEVLGFDEEFVEGICKDIQVLLNVGAVFGFGLVKDGAGIEEDAG